MSTDLRDLLDRVASGEISPEEGQRLLAGTHPVAAAPSLDDPVHRVSLRFTGVRLVVLADPGVATAIADGPHRVSRQDDLLIITSDLMAGDYSAEGPWSAFRTWINSGFRPGERVSVRVNPHLPLDVQLTAGSLSLSGMQAPVSVTADAAAARLQDGRGPLQLKATTGSADVAWQFIEDSRITVELGSAAVRIQPGSDAAVTVSASAGAASVTGPEGSRGSTPAGGNIAPFSIGDGRGSLDVSAHLGSVDVTVL